MTFRIHYYNIITYRGHCFICNTVNKMTDVLFRWWKFMVPSYGCELCIHSLNDEMIRHCWTWGIILQLMWSKETSHFLSKGFPLMAYLLMAAIVNKLCIANVMKSNESWPQNHAERYITFDIVSWNGWKWHPQMLHQSYKKRNFLKRLKSLQVKICTVVWMDF